MYFSVCLYLVLTNFKCTKCDVVVFLFYFFFFSFLLLCRLWFLWPDDNLKNKRSKNKCGCLGGCRFFGGTLTGLDFFKLEELTPSSSSAFSSTSAESDMFYGQSLLQPGEWIITKEIPKILDGENALCCNIIRFCPKESFPNFALVFMVFLILAIE